MLFIYQIINVILKKQSIMTVSNTNTNIFCYFLCVVLLCFCFHCCKSKDNITVGESIHDGTEFEFLESAGNKFQMGFFSRKMGSERRGYIGIWYSMDPKTVVWVANRNQPVLDSFGVLTITKDGEVNLLDKDGKVYFTSTGGGPQMALKLLDSGNAVLINTTSGNIEWQSFLNPTDTFLPGMKLDSELKLTAWKSVDDPSSGSFVFQKEESGQYVILNTDNSTTHWKSGFGSMNNFDPNQLNIDVYYLLTNSTTRTKEANYCKLNNNTQRKDLNYCNGRLHLNNSEVFNDYSRLLMSYTGKIQYLSLAESSKPNWEEPKDNCSIYGACGNFGLCNVSNYGICSCLPGFKPYVPNDYSAGCKIASDTCSTNDLFMNLTMIKVENPSLPFFKSDNESDCKNRCLTQTCKCKAYSYSSADNESIRSGRQVTNRCWIWDSDLNNLQTDGTHNISIRVLAGYLDVTKESPLENSSTILTKSHILIFTMTVVGVVLLCSLSYIYYKRLVNREPGRNHVLQLDNSERWAMDLLDLVNSRDDKTEGIGIPFYQFEAMQVATDNFSDANKLGQGGFGPVYKGTLHGGLEVAVKRLCSLSGQGLEEFRNEVLLIAKLQHRNLVRLLGYCIKGNEKILVYEYMLNKSLDCFIFDQSPSISLDWARRYEIIIGIARGLLYLHQDSRLRIIHRDLKTSNILLDEELNPKISDFGLAKIVQGRDMEASTNRVIGTYGYMAPEYALDGFFSIKSDVFSFGVVVLEIISGKKNTGSAQFHQSLLGYAWNLWKEDMAISLMDQRLSESSNSSEILKCIIIGLLCVQEDPGDRPTMMTVVLMLAGDIASLPAPKQPAFVARKAMPSSSSSSNKPDQTQTNNTFTITLQEGR